MQCGVITPPFLVARRLFHDFSQSISIVIQWQVTFYFCHLDRSKNEGEKTRSCARKEVAKSCHRKACCEVDDRFQFVISRCEVVSNLKNGFKDQELLPLSLPLPFLRGARGCRFKFTSSQIAVCNPTGSLLIISNQQFRINHRHVNTPHVTMC